MKKRKKRKIGRGKKRKHLLLRCIQTRLFWYCTGVAALVSTVFYFRQSIDAFANQQSALFREIYEGFSEKPKPLKPDNIVISYLNADDSNVEILKSYDKGIKNTLIRNHRKDPNSDLSKLAYNLSPDFKEVRTLRLPNGNIQIVVVLRTYPFRISIGQRIFELSRDAAIRPTPMQQAANHPSKTSHVIFKNFLDEETWDLLQANPHSAFLPGDATKQKILDAMLLADLLNENKEVKEKRENQPESSEVDDNFDLLSIENAAPRGFQVNIAPLSSSANNPEHQIISVIFGQPPYTKQYKKFKRILAGYSQKYHKLDKMELDFANKAIVKEKTPE